MLEDLEIIKETHNDTIEICIKYMNGLIRKLEHPDSRLKKEDEKE